MVKLGEGEFAEVFRIEEGKVVKLFKKDLFDAEDFESEHTIAKFMGDTTDFAPRVYEKVMIEDRHGYTMDEISGNLLQDEIELNFDRYEDYGRLMGRSHRMLHEKEVVEVLAELPECKAFLGDFFGRNKSLPSKVNEWLLKMLKGIHGKTSLLHSDFTPNNIMIEQGVLKVLDWAEPSLGPAILDVARTINFVMDPTDFPDKKLTGKASLFVKAYLDGYYGEKGYDKNEMLKAFLINGASEVAWAERSGQVDEYSDYLKALIMSNFESEEPVFPEFLK